MIVYLRNLNIPLPGKTPSHTHIPTYDAIWPLMVSPIAFQDDTAVVWNSGALKNARVDS